MLLLYLQFFGPNSILNVFLGYVQCPMDFDNGVPVDAHETGHPNGIHEQSPPCGEDAISNGVNETEGLSVNIANVSISEDTTTNTSCTGEVCEESNDHARTNGQTGSKVGCSVSCCLVDG